MKIKLTHDNPECIVGSVAQIASHFFQFSAVHVNKFGRSFREVQVEELILDHQGHPNLCTEDRIYPVQSIWMTSRYHNLLSVCVIQPVLLDVCLVGWAVDGWLFTHRYALINCVAVITMVSRALYDEFIRFYFYQLTWSHEPTVHHCYYMRVDGQATTILVEVAILFGTRWSCLCVSSCLYLSSTVFAEETLTMWS